MGNFRGSGLSRIRDHPSLQEYLSQFDYSFQEMGLFDVPAMVRFVASQTGKASVNLIAHSQGASAVLTALAFNSYEVRDQVGLFIALAPVTTMQELELDDLTPWLGPLTFLSGLIDFVNILGKGFYPDNNFVCGTRASLCGAKDQFDSFFKVPGFLSEDLNLAHYCC